MKTKHIKENIQTRTNKNTIKKQHKQNNTTNTN